MDLRTISSSKDWTELLLLAIINALSTELVIVWVLWGLRLIFIGAFP